METSRRLFAELVLPESDLGVRVMYEPARISEAMTMPWAPGVRADAEPVELVRTLCESAHGYLSVYRERFAAILDAGDADDRRSLLDRVVLDLAPTVIGSTHLLHGVVGNWNNDAPYALAALRAYASDVGAGQPEASRADRYWTLMRRHGLSDAGSDLRHTAEDPRISEGAFALPAAFMLLGIFPESLTGQVLGSDLCLRALGLVPAAELAAVSDPELTLALDPSRDPTTGETEPLKASQEAAEAFLTRPGATADDAEALVQGFLWCRARVAAFHESLCQVLERWLDPRAAVEDLVARRRRDARVYHEKTMVGDRSLRELLDPSASPVELVDALEGSRYVRQGNPDRSPLVTGLISLRGRMFRIFSQQDVATLRRWIAAMPYGPRPVGTPSADRRWDDEPVLESARRTQGAAAVARRGTSELRIDLPEAYTRLLHTEISEAEHRWALHYAERWLRRAGDGASNGHCPLPDSWRPHQLTGWLQDYHEASARSFEENGRQIPTEVELTRDVLSLAPLTMIDGAWLLGHTHPALASTGVGFSLFETFFDELGNGRVAENHPKIYRDLVRTIHGELPPTPDPGYARSECFSPEDLELPVFWLAIGRFARRYQPEVLGLNLAMELSGVGGGYRRTHAALKAYRLPTLFVDLHNTIDNVATGHAAWAAHSIDAYVAGSVEGERQGVWDRVRTGFVALNPPAPRLIDRLVSYAGRRAYR